MIFRSYVKSFQSPFHYNRRHRFSTQPLSSSLILDIPIQLQGFQDIASRYDIILFDQFGVLHDGKTLFPGVLKVLQQLQNLNKTLGVVSNTSRRSIDAIKAMTQLDVPSNTFESFITSGELAFNYVNNKYSHRETSCTVLTWKGTQVSFLSTLNIKLAPPETADFIYLHGSESMQVSEHSSQSTPLDLINTGVLDASIETMLRVALRRNLPLICANSDHSAVSNDRLLYMPGLIAERYEEMGGEVFHFGKPYKPVFETAIDECLSIRNQISTNIDTSTPVAAAVETVVTTSKTTCSSFDMNPMRERMRDLTLRRQRSRILHVGDSLSHDILGKLTN